MSGFEFRQDVALGRLPYKVTDDPMVTPLRELVYLPKGVLNPHGVPDDAHRAGLLPVEILEQSVEDINNTQK